MTADPAVLPPRPAGGQAARVRWAAASGVGQLDGGWWPRSDDVVVELDELLEACADQRGQVSRVALCTADWPLPHPTRAVQRGRTVKVGWFTRMERHTVTLGTSSVGAPRALLLVVPDGATDEQAERDLQAASTPTSSRVTQLLADLG